MPSNVDLSIEEERQAERETLAVARYVAYHELNMPVGSFQAGMAIGVLKGRLGTIRKLALKGDLEGVRAATELGEWESGMLAAIMRGGEQR